MVEYFSVKISSIGTGYSYVRAWTETSAGSNYSDPYEEVQADSKYHTIDYTTVPNKGNNVTLNLDNPVYTTSTVPVSGEWSPN